MVVGKDLAKHLVHMVVVLVDVGYYHYYHDHVKPPMAATPSDSACFVSSKVSLKLQPETCKVSVKMKALEKDSSVIYVLLSPSKDYNMYKSQGQRAKCDDFSIKYTCAMMVGQ